MEVLVAPAIGAHVVAEPAVEAAPRFDAHGRAVPLADERGPIAGLLQELRKQHLTRQPVEVELGALGEEVVDPVLRGNPAGQKTGPCRGAHRRRAGGVGHEHPGGRQRVEGRRFHLFVAIGAGGPLAVVVCEEEHDIWRPGRNVVVLHRRRAAGEGGDREAGRDTGDRCAAVIESLPHGLLPS